ncbi:MAG: PsbP-related protein [bacterium]|nr:PsbP-related protein [bacterium]
MKKQTIVIALAILVLIGLGWVVVGKKGGEKIASDDITTVATTTKKIYENSSFGINFNYPSNLFVEESKNNILITSIPPNDPRRQSSAMMGALSLFVAQGKEIKNIQETRKKETLSSKEVTLDGHKAVELTSVPDGYSGGTWISILVKTKNGILEIRYLKGTTYEEAYLSIIESIRIQ